MDNLAIKGLDDESPARRGKKRRGRKPFIIEARLVVDPETSKHSIMRQLGVGNWWAWGRYETAARRDQAYAALVRKAAATRLPRWSHWEYRKSDD